MYQEIEFKYSTNQKGVFFWKTNRNCFTMHMHNEINGVLAGKKSRDFSWRSAVKWSTNLIMPVSDI